MDIKCIVRRAGKRPKLLSFIVGLVVGECGPIKEVIELVVNNM